MNEPQLLSYACAGCGAPVFDNGIACQEAWADVRGLRRHVSTVVLEGIKTTVTETPTICARGSCLDAVMAQKGWSRTDWKALREQRDAEYASWKNEESEKRARTAHLQVELDDLDARWPSLVGAVCAQFGIELDTTENNMIIGLGFFERQLLIKLDSLAGDNENSATKELFRANERASELRGQIWSNPSSSPP